MQWWFSAMPLQSICAHTKNLSHNKLAFCRFQRFQLEGFVGLFHLPSTAIGQILVSRPKLEIGTIMKKCFAWLAAALVPTIGYCQDTVDLGTTQVEAYRFATPIMASARNVAVLTQHDIQSLPVQSVQELLLHIGGIDLQQRGAWGTQADISIRGGSFDQALVLINGMKINDPQTGHHHLNFDMALADIERIEVIKGPAASRYGVNAFNGVINIITRTSETSSIQAEVLAAKGVNDIEDPYLGQRIAVSGNLGGNRVQQSIGLSSQMSNGYRPMTESQRNAMQYTGRSQHKLGNTEALVMLCDNRFGASGFYAWPIDSSSVENVRTAYAALQHSLTISNWKVSANAYHRYNRDIYTLFREAPQVYQNDHTTHTTGFNADATLYTSFGQFQLGGEQRMERINSSNLGVHALQNTGLFSSHRGQWWDDRIQSMVSLYTNFAKGYRPQWLPSAEFSARITPKFSTFLSWGSALRTPTFTDRYYQGPTNIGNPALKPETANSFELGIKTRTGAHLLQASAFRRLATNLIDWTRLNENEPWQPRNHANVQTDGIEINYAIQRKFILSNQWSIHQLRVNYLYLHSEVAQSDDLQSRYSLNHLPHLASAQLGLQWRGSLALTTSAVMRAQADEPVAWLLDARIQYSTSTFKCWIDATNLLNQEVIQAGSAPLPLRWLRAGIGFKLTNEK